MHIAYEVQIKKKTADDEPLRTGRQTDRRTT